MHDKNILPPNFDGNFYFTNPTSEDFIGRWNNIAYTFPANKTTKMIIMGEPPEGVQSIRKKFAKELAEREFFTSPKLKALEAATPLGSATSMHAGLTYGGNELNAFVQKCLEPLEVGQLTATALPNDAQNSTVRTDESGQAVHKVFKEGESVSLVGQGTPIA